MNCLIVEDDFAARRLMRRWLSDFSDCDIAVNGVEAVDAFKNALDKDRIVQHTTVGVHKDDLILTLEKYPIKKAGSQGQQKTFLVSLKLAQFDFIKQISGLKPVLLLDDVFDKFDKQRVRQIIELVAENHFGQIFITDTSKDRLEIILKEIDIKYTLFAIESGENNVVNKVD